MNIGIIGIGIVSVQKNINLYLFDKYKNIGKFSNLLQCEIIFL